MRCWGPCWGAAFVLVVPFATKVEGRRRNGRGRASVALAIVGLSLTLAAPVGLKAAALAPTGATFTVTSTADAVDANLGDGVCSAASGACTLRAAIQQANASGAWTRSRFPPAPTLSAIHGQNQNLAESGDLDVTGPLTIAGAGATSTIVDGGTPASVASEIRGLDRLFEIHPGAGDVSLVDLAVQEGYSAEQGGAIYHASAGTLHLERVQVLDSYAAKYGGGIANASTGQVELVDSIVSGTAPRRAEARSPTSWPAPSPSPPEARSWTTRGRAPTTTRSPAARSTTRAKATPSARSRSSTRPSRPTRHRATARASTTSATAASSSCAPPSRATRRRPAEPGSTATAAPSSSARARSRTTTPGISSAPVAGAGSTTPGS